MFDALIFTDCRRLTASACLFTVFSVTLGLFAGGINPAEAKHRDVDWGSLNLNADQSNRIQGIESQWKNTASELLPQINQDKSELMHLLNTPNSDQRRIMELQNRINANKARLQHAAMQTYLKKKEQLTPDQQNRLQFMMGQ